MHIAKVYFLKSRDDEQRLHEPLVREQSHDEPVERPRTEQGTPPHEPTEPREPGH